MSITVTPLSKALGARITGIDLRDELDAGTAQAVRQAFLDNVIIVIPDQQIEDADQERFCRHFGELEIVRSAAAADSEHPSVLLITNVRGTGRATALEDGDMMFHYDQCYYEHPAMGSTLFAMRVPDQGGNTLEEYLEGHGFTAVCRDCDRQVRLDGQELDNRYGANTEAANVRDRSPCSAWVRSQAS